ncbi:hypothetical protein WISP_60107 [Willisornis vidua]|uniref:Uncharacterized protein n=1 Tax=Willisornis vidua TaxID=1566151 RepID=A0ABQ9DDT0_9PASS|nr:hypothetical protein WISP_60107 [Willisornis vidua]
MEQSVKTIVTLEQLPPSDPKGFDLMANEPINVNSDLRNVVICFVVLRGKLEIYHLSTEQPVFEIINEVRRKGVDNMIYQKEKFGSTKNNDLKEHLSKVWKYISVPVNKDKDDILVEPAEDNFGYCILAGTLVG